MSGSIWRRDSRPTTPAGVVDRAQMVTWPAEGKSVTEVMELMSVSRVWNDAGIKPWKQDTFKFSTDPELAGKVTDVRRRRRTRQDQP